MVLTGIFGGLTEPNRFPPGIAAPARAEILFGSVFPPKNNPWVLRNVSSGGFSYGEPESEAGFGLAPRNGVLSPSEPGTQEPFMSPFRADTRNGAQIRTFCKILGSIRQNIGSRGI